MTFVIVNRIFTRTASIFLDENNILHFAILENVRIDYEDALDNALVIKSLSNNKPILKLIDMRANCTIEKKAQKFIDSNEIKHKTIARAVIKGSLFNRILIKFFMSLNKNSTPTKIFADYDEAYTWLLNLKHK